MKRGNYGTSKRRYLWPFLLFQIHAVGTFGKAYDFIDFLVRTKQRYWLLLLPLVMVTLLISLFCCSGSSYYRFKRSWETWIFKSDDFENISLGLAILYVDYGAFVNHRRLLNRTFDRFMQMFLMIWEVLSWSCRVAWSLCGVHVSKGRIWT